MALAEVQVNGQTLSLTYSNSNSSTNLNWSVTNVAFVANSPTTTVQVVSLNAGNGGMYFDTFKMEQIQVTTNLYRYTFFSDDTTKAHTPIKFGVPPYANTNQDLTNLVLGSFETVSPGVYSNTSLPFEGWQVVTNEVSVIYDPNLAYHGTNLLALSSAVLDYNLPTIPDTEYKLTVSYRGPDHVAWWPFDANPPVGTAVQDIVNLIPAFYWGAPTLVNAEVGRGVSLDGLGDYVEVPQPMPVEFGANLGLSIETWINAANLTDPQPLVEWNSGFGAVGANLWISVPPPDGGGPGSLCADLVDTVGTSHPIASAAGAVGAGFHHVAMTYQAWSGDAALYVDGAPVAGANLGQFFPVTTYDLFFGLRPSGPNGGTLFQGILDEVTFFNRALSPAEVWGIYNSATNGKFDPLTPQANFTLSVPNLFTNLVVAGTNWTTFTTTFVANSTNAAIRFTGHPLGVLIDKLEVAETGNKFYLPEESLRPLLETDGFGTWQIEVWDNRLGGQVTNGALLSWELKLGFMRTNTVVIPLIDHIAYTTNVLDTNLLFFTVYVGCTNGGTVVQTLQADAPVDLLFNRFGPPTTTAGDVVLMAATMSDTNIMDIPGPLLPQPGRYFLAVRNASSNNANFTLQVDIACLPSFANGVTLQPAGYGPDGFVMTWQAPRTAAFQVQYTESLAQPSWITFPRIITSTTTTFTFKDESAPSGGGATGGRFYRVIQLSP